MTYMVLESAKLRTFGSERDIGVGNGECSLPKVSSRSYLGIAFLVMESTIWILKSY